MTIRSDASLRGKSKALAQKYNLAAQEVMQMYLFERFLARLAESEYREIFILKGGLLISSLIGVSSRTTMDMDATLRSLTLDKNNVEKMISNICSAKTDDGIKNTAKHRGTLKQMEDYSLVCDEMIASKAVERMWANYIDRNRFAASVSLKECIDAVRAIGDEVFSSAEISIR